MKKIPASLRTALGVGFGLWFGQILAAVAQEQAQFCSDPGSTMLWEVQGAQLRERDISLFLFGSMHVGKPDFYPLPPPVEASFREAEYVVFEVDPRSVTNPAVAQELARRSQLPADQTLEQLLSPDTLKSLQDVIAQEGLAVDIVMRLKPWMISLLLADVQSSSLGFDAAWGLESYFLAQMPQDAEVLELEGLRQQVDMLESLDPDVFLSYSLREYQESAKQIEALVKAWRCADHAALESLLFDEEDSPDLSAEERKGLIELNRRLFSERNRVMADGIIELIETGKDDYFVVVGAGHLLGADSVVELLRAEGFTVQPVRL